MESHSADQIIKMGCPLVPITHPRKIVESLGNILAKLDINGEPSPASKELQVNIPILLQARQKQVNYDPKSARVGVWALVIPERLLLDHGDLQTSLEATRKPSVKYDPKLRMARLDTAIDKLAFEMETAAECTAWERYSIIYDILRQGGRLHQILSGGGEWGAKASLLSLDPQTIYGEESEEDELDRFQRSFHGEGTAEGAITRPGDFVQFFVEGTPVMRGGPMALTDAAGYPLRSFGVGEFRKETNGPKSDGHSLQKSRHLVQLAPFHFGAFSAEGLYLTSTGSVNSTKTKINTPGTNIYTMPLGVGAQEIEDLKRGVGHGGHNQSKRFSGEKPRRLGLR
ncbi:hypothetical protein N0V82_003242 [Gnomoniopsis sp. IMI 355080]|nr:hypothetical protein N0V82_003242 [Gnomoniopsis sp. IMI 355080]